MNNQRNTTDWKIVVLGSSGVGKTAIIHRYCNGVFNNDTLTTIGAGFYSHSLALENSDVNLLIWDTAGEERFRSVAPSLLRGANGLILVYDVCDPKTFEELPIFYQMFLDIVAVDFSTELPIILLGNKYDCENHLITQEQMDSWCEKNRITMKFNVSAKTGMNIDESFSALVKSLNKPSVASQKPAIQLRVANPAKKKCC